MARNKRIRADGRILCPDCSKRAGKPIYKPAAEFGRRSNRTYQTRCKHCHAEWMREHYRKQKKQSAPTIHPNLETELHRQRQDVIFKLWPTLPNVGN